MTKLPIDGSRLWSTLMTIGAIAALPGGGNDRLTLTDGDRDARNLLAFWGREAGLVPRVDAMGNMVLRREGADPSLPPVMMGSHLDTQSPGGRFDGVLGVLAGLEVMRALDDAGIGTRRAIELVNWTNEEGARFRPGLMGSAVWTGATGLEQAQAATDRDGRSVGGELRRIRWLGDAPIGTPADSYFELHIEQAALLEQAGVVIGAVTHSHWTWFAEIACHGENAHIQSMPMRDRRNALAGAARLIVAIEEIGLARAPEGSISATVLDCWPNNAINIPHLAVLQLGATHPDEAGAQGIADATQSAADAIAARTGLRFETRTSRMRAPVHFDPALVDLVAGCAEGIGLSAMRMRTRPGHDAFNLARHCPSALIFVPCRDGLSHSEREWCEPAHCAAGAAVLGQAVLSRAEG